MKLVKNYVFGLYDSIKYSVQPFQLKNQSEKTRAFLAVGVVSFFWGTTWLASKLGVSHMPALEMAGIRHFAGGFLYVLFFTIKGHPLPNRQQLIQFTWMGLLMFVISSGFTTWSVKFIPSGLGAVIGAISPIWIALFSVIFFRSTRLNRTTILGFILGFAGILIIFYEYLEAIFNSDFIFGIILGIIATMTWAFGTIYTVEHAKNLDPYYSMGWQMLISGVILLLLSLLIGQFIPFSEINHISWLSIGYLVIIGSIITFWAFIYSLKRLPAAQASVYAYINPIVAVILGALLNHEKLNLRIAIGTVVTLLGVYLVNYGFRISRKSK